jgi:drug/metabolite transporter (DMT)-like permease
MTRSQAGAVALVMMIGVLWGLNWPAVKFILGSIPPWTFRALAFSLGAVLLAVMAHRAGEHLRVPARERMPMIIASLLTVFGFNVFTAFGQLLTETSKAAIIAFTMPMWAALLAVVFLGERFGLNRLAALLLGMAGLATLLAGDARNFIDHPAGFLFMLGAAVSWAAGTVLLKARDWTIAPLARAAWLVGVSAIPAWAGAVLFEQPWTLSLPNASVFAVFAFHVVGPVALCYAAWVSLVSRLPASTAAIGTLLIPVVGVLSSSLLLGDVLTLDKIIALGLIVSSVALTFIQPMHSRR